RQGTRSLSPGQIRLRRRRPSIYNPPPAFVGSGSFHEMTRYRYQRLAARLRIADPSPGLLVLGERSESADGQTWPASFVMAMSSICERTYIKDKYGVRNS